MINLIKVDKIELKDNKVDDNIYIFPKSLNIGPGLHAFYILDVLYSDVPINYSYHTTFLEFNLSGLNNFQISNFVRFVEDKGLKVQIDEVGLDDYEVEISSLIDEMMPNRKELILSWLKKTKVLVKGEFVPVDDEVFRNIRKDMTDIECEDLAALFLIDDENLNPLNHQSVPYIVSLHSKDELDFDLIGELDLYVKIIKEDMEPSLILINNEDIDTMKKSNYIYELPYPSKTLFKKNDFGEEEASQYRELYEMFDDYIEECFKSEFGDYSKIGGYIEKDIEYATINHDQFDFDRDWKHLLMLSSYSHPCDFFRDIGDCHVNVMVIESVKDGEVILESRIILNYS